MQTCILTLGILLAGQISDSSGTRYSVLPPAAPANGATVETAQSLPAQPPIVQPPAGQQPWSDRTPMTPPPATQPPARRVAPAGLTKVIKPADLLQSLAKPVGSEKLVGVPLSLGEAVQKARSRTEQTRRVTLYWELSQAIVEFHLASREELELKSLSSGLGQKNQSWGSALQAATARQQVARSAVEVAQHCLHKELGLQQGSQQDRGRTSSDLLPLPSDLPHCGAYETKYEQIFQGRTSREAEQLSKLLPLRHKDLSQRALESTTARERLISLRGQLNPQGDSTQLLKSYEQLALQRQAFVATAFQYNANIARYTELAVPQEIGTVRLVSMLIQSGGKSGDDWQPGAIRRAAAEERVPQQNNAGHYQPRTYGNPGRSETRRVPTGEAKGEHSILVQPQRSDQ